MLFYSCSNDSEKAPTIPELTDEILVYEPTKISDNLVLVADPGADEVYLLQKDGKRFHEWTLTDELGNDAYLEDDGKLLAILKTGNDKIIFGGSGGQIQVINPDNSIDWKFVYSTEDYNLHHDVESSSPCRSGGRPFAAGRSCRRPCASCAGADRSCGSRA